MRIVVVGAGAAGLVAAAEAARRSAEVLLLEKNSKTGVKILMSGGTRCNLTHDTDAKGIVRGFGRGGRFLQPSVGAFPPSAVVEMFHRLGVATKVESTGKIFPISNRAVHVRDALERSAIEAGVEIRRGSGVLSLGHDGGRWQIETSGETLTADRVIVTAGGRSWPGCGTTGDAYAWLRGLGHTIVAPRPALVPLVGGDPWMHQLSGLTIPDLVVSVHSISKTGTQPRLLVDRRGSWLFTHFGFSGPAAMDVSGTVTAAASPADVRLSLDLLPEVGDQSLRTAFSDRSADGGRRTAAAVLNRWLPQRLCEALVLGAGASGPLAQLPSRNLRQLVEQVKRLPIEVSGTRGFEKAEVTAGGVELSEVDPRTMASRRVNDLFIAGEVLDVDGWIGGYNFQAAFSTGRAAGIAAATCL